MLAPAEILQMEDYERSPKKFVMAGLDPATQGKFVGRSNFGPPALRPLGGRVTPRLPGHDASFVLGRLSPVAMLAALCFAVGVYFIGNAAYIQGKAVLAQVLLDRAWETTLATGKPTKAWSWADTWPVARISFPTLHETAIVLQEGGGEAMAFGPAHVAASPKPGATGVSVIGGHRDTHFNFIKNLKVGDEIVIETPERTTVRYRMTGSAIVHAGASGLATKAKAQRLALVTCYPFDAVGRGPLRYVVFAEAK